jgi:ADP-ribose pyrophosphatase YjhB (NUDIX family)
VAVREERGQWFVALLKTEHKRGDVWVLPKGHVEMDRNEGIPEAARREVEEEIGLKDLSVKDQLGVTKFSFQAETALVRKTVHYFLMITGQKQLFPQAEEGFSEAAWFPIDVAITTLIYDTDQDIVRKAREKLLGVPSPRPLQPKNNRSIRVHT